MVITYKVYVLVLQILMNIWFLFFTLDKIVFSCHCKRHDPFKDKEEKNQFELVQFFGYFQPSSEIYHGNNLRISSLFSSEEDDLK